MIDVYTYGCSFTAGYEELLFSEYTWPNLLNLSQQYRPVNKGHGGGGFHDVRKYVMQDLGQNNRDDIFIIQLPTSNRVIIPYFETEWDSFMRILHLHGTGTIGWLKYLKDVEGLKLALAQEVEVLFDLLTRLGIKWMWWSAEKTDPLLTHKYSDNMLYISGYDCYEDWIWNSRQFWRKEDDWHQNMQGHVVMAESFSNQINSYFYGKF